MVSLENLKSHPNAKTVMSGSRKRDARERVRKSSRVERKVPEAGFEPATLRFLICRDYESYALTKLSYPGLPPEISRCII